METIKTFDTWVLNQLYGMNLHPKLNVVLRKFTRLGDGYIWVPVILYILVAYDISSGLRAIAHAAITSVLSILVYKFVKKKVARPRPYNAHDHVVAQIEPMDTYSFPSGHTMNNLAPGVAIALNFPQLAPLTIGIPLLWGLLRIYFGVHYFSDVIGGLFLASLCALLGSQLFNLLPNFL